MKNSKQNFFLNSCLTLGFLAASTSPGPLSAEVIIGQEEETGLRTWEWRQAGVSVQLVQRSPDQTRAFFQGRGFSPNDADIIGLACVFQTIFRNDGKQPLSYDLDAWQITYQGKHIALLTRDRWEQQWLERGVNQAARIAFRWSLLPTRQSFEPGDYNWGMTSFGLAPGSSFDLSLELMVNGTPIKDRIPAVVCADDLQ